MTASPAGSKAVRDDLGYLLDWGDWSPELGQFLAAEDGVELTAEHWEVIEFLREFYGEYAMAPPMRMLVKTLTRRWGPERGGSRHLYRLFPEGPAKQACKYAGLPKPTSCI